MKPDLYICHTPYQVLVTLCRAFDSPCPPQLILSTTIPTPILWLHASAPPALWGRCAFLTKMPVDPPC